MNITRETWRRVRLGLYVMAAAAGAGWTAYEASGDWHDAVGPALGTVIAALAAVNTRASEEG